MGDIPQGPRTEPERHSAAERLDSWKEIAEYLRRSVRTVRRWEQEEGLPVYRHLHQNSGTVYAFKIELDGWLASRSAQQVSTAALEDSQPDSAELAAASKPSLGCYIEQSALSEEHRAIFEEAPQAPQTRSPTVAAFRRFTIVRGLAAAHPTFIETLSRLGYPFIAPSERPSTDEALRAGTDIDDARSQSGDQAQGSGSLGNAGETSRSAAQLFLNRRRSSLILACLLIVAAVALWKGTPSRQAPTADIANQMQVTFDGDVFSAALSPDGKTVAYLSDDERGTRLLVRDVSGGQALEL
jgi:hypothetical protein